MKNYRVTYYIAFLHDVWIEHRLYIKANDASEVEDKFRKAVALRHSDTNMDIKLHKIELTLEGPKDDSEE